MDLEKFFGVTEVDPIDSHSHYGEEVKTAVKKFAEVFYYYDYSVKFNFKHENAYRLDTVQGLWNRLLRARKAETGVAYFLTKKQHSQIIKGNNGNAS